MGAVTPGQADEVPELFARWYSSGWPVTDEVAADAWQYALPAERQFWRSLDAEHAAIAARQPQPAPGELPKGHFEHLQAIGVADNLRGQLHETRTALSTLLDRTEGTSVLTGDERDDYGRVLMKPHGKPQPAPLSASQVRRHAEQAAPGVCPRCGSQERTDRRQVRGFAGPTTACYSDWHDAGQPAPELAGHGDCAECDTPRVACPAHSRSQPEVSRDLAAAMAESRRYREALERVRAIILEGGQQHGRQPPAALARRHPRSTGGQVNEDQLIEAAEREMDLYRAEVERLHATHAAEIASLAGQRNRVSDTADRLRGQLALYGEALQEIARRTDGHGPGTTESGVHHVAVSALALNGVPDGPDGDAGGTGTGAESESATGSTGDRRGGPGAGREGT